LESGGNWQFDSKQNLKVHTMKVEIFCLCDFAQPADQGKLNIIGLFDTLGFDNVPARIGLFAVAIKLKIGSTDIGQKKIKISFFDPEKKPILTGIEAAIQVQPVLGFSHSNIQLISLIPQLQFLSFGEYSIDLEIDGQQVASTQLRVIQLSSSSPHLRPQPQTV
jgi:hypothetical protein